LRDLLAFVQATGIQPVIDQELPLDQARKGFARMAAGDVFGNIVFNH